MPRTLTSYRRPSVETLLATTGTIESLAAMRAEIQRGITSGEIDPSAKTRLRWLEALWVRVLELMALLPARAPYIFNLTLTWPKPPGLQETLEAQLKLVTGQLPAAAEEVSVPSQSMTSATPTRDAAALAGSGGADDMRSFAGKFISERAASRGGDSA